MNDTDKSRPLYRTRTQNRFEASKQDKNEDTDDISHFSIEILSTGPITSENPNITATNPPIVISKGSCCGNMRIEPQDIPQEPISKYMVCFFFYMQL